MDQLVINPDELGPDPVAGLDLAVALGVSGVEMRMAWDANVITLDDTQVSRLAGLVAERELEVVALASPLWKWCLPSTAAAGPVDSFGFPTQVDATERVRWVRRAVQVAEILGARVLRVFSGLSVAGEQGPGFLDDPLVSLVLDLAGAAGVRVLIENEPVCTIASAAAVLEVLTKLGLDRGAVGGLGLWLDIANLHHLGEATPEAIASLAPWVEYVHVKDFRTTEAGRVFCPAGAGEVPYARLLPLLRELRPGLAWALETHVRDDPAAAITAGATFLRSHISDVPA